MVSAIITTYKREPSMVLRALDSIISQTYKDIEIIVVDDSPADYSEREAVRSAVMKRKSENSNIKITYIAHDKNMGACVARNTGLDTAEGEYVAYLDDDDEWLPEKIEKQIDVIRNSDVALVYCGKICKNDTSGKSVIGKKEYIRGNVFERLLYSNFIESTSYPLIRTKCLIAIGGFDPLMQSAQDYDVWLRLAERYDIDYVSEPLVIYHEHDGERITTNPVKKIKGLERINSKFTRYIEANRKLWWARHMGLARHYAMNDEKKKALELWLKCVSKYPEKIKENTIYLYYILLKTHKNG